MTDLSELTAALQKVDIHAALRLAQGRCPDDGRMLSEGQWIRWCSCGWTGVLHRRRPDSGQDFASVGPYDVNTDTGLIDAIQEAVEDARRPRTHEAVTLDFQQAQADLLAYGETYIRTR